MRHPSGIKPNVVWLDDFRDPWQDFAAILQNRLGEACSVQYFSDDDIAAKYIAHHASEIAVLIQDINRPNHNPLIATWGAFRAPSRLTFPVQMTGGDFYFYIVDNFIPEASCIFHSGNLTNAIDPSLIAAWAARDSRVVFLEKPVAWSRIVSAVVDGIERWKGRPLTRDIDSETRLVAPVAEELAAICGADPLYLDALSGRQFEELIGAVLKNNGFSVELTSTTRDGGFDLKATSNSKLPKEVTLVEIKRYGPQRTVPVSVVRALYGVKKLHAADRALLVTTSRVSAYAKTEFKRTIPMEMEIAERQNVEEWCRQYRNDLFSDDFSG